MIESKFEMAKTLLVSFREDADKNECKTVGDVPAMLKSLFRRYRRSISAIVPLCWAKYSTNKYKENN